MEIKTDVNASVFFALKKRFVIVSVALIQCQNRLVNYFGAFVIAIGAISSTDS